MFDNSIQVVPLFGQFWVKTKVTWEDEDKSSEIAALSSRLHCTLSVFEISNTILTLLFLQFESSLFPLIWQIEFLHNKIKC